MSRLKDGIPRAFKDHRRRESRRYNEAVRALYAQYPNIPSCARPIVKEYGRVVLELDKNAPAVERAIEIRRLSEARRLRREGRVLRFMLLKLHSQIERLAGVATVLPDPFEKLLEEEERE